MADDYVDVDYELWKRGYRINGRNYSLNQFYEELESIGLSFDELFERMLRDFPERFIDEAAEEERFRKENEPKVREIFEKNFRGKTFADIRNDEALLDLWGFYSDYHKDVFGYRPHAVVCGVYVSPY